MRCVKQFLKRKILNSETNRKILSSETNKTRRKKQTSKIRGTIQNRSNWSFSDMPSQWNQMNQKKWMNLDIISNEKWKLREHIKRYDFFKVQGVKQGTFEENSFENKMPQSFWKTFQMNLKDCKEIKDKHKNWEWHIWSWAGSDQTTSNFQKYSMNTFEKKFFILFSARASIYETKTQKSKLRHHLFFFKFLINSEIFLISPHFCKYIFLFSSFPKN